MKVSIVIPAYNEEKYIGQTLQSINKLVKGDFETEVLVIDPHSTDKTVEIAKSFGAKVIEIPHKNIGYARAKGIKAATGEIIVFTDADTLVPENWLIRHVNTLRQKNVVCSWGGFKFTDGKFPILQFANYIQPVFIYLFDKIVGLPVASGQNMAFWKDKALEVGGFDEKMKVMEDTDLAVRMTKIGKVIYQPDLLIYTSGRRSVEGWHYFVRAGGSFIDYFILGRRKLEGFPDIR